MKIASLGTIFAIYIPFLKKARACIKQMSLLTARQLKNKLIEISRQRGSKGQVLHRVFVQCLVQWVLTWSCPLIVTAEQTLDNKEVASNAQVKLSYQICVVCSPHASSSPGAAATAAYKDWLKPKEKSIDPTASA